MQCTNNLKQYGVALHNYHDINNSLPASQAATKGENIRLGTCAVLFPYMEQQANWDLIVANPDAQNWHAPLYDMYVTTLMCPSDPAPGNYAGGSSTMNYMVCLGDVCTYIGVPWGDSSWYYGGRNNWYNENVVPSDWSQPHDKIGNNRMRGMFAAFIFKNFSAIIDGLSNSVAASESIALPIGHTSVVGGYGSYNKIKGGTAAEIGGTAFMSSGPQICLDRVDPNDTTLFTGKACRINRGRPITDGFAATSAFETVLPPNSPSCGYGPGDETSALQSATSNHKGGVNVLFGDGAVKFVSDTVDCGNLKDAPVIVGPSRYGIWGALGTVQGGENVTL